MPDSADISPSSALAIFGVMVGPDRGAELPVLNPVVNIGQGPQNDIVLEDDSVSRSHARLEYKMGSWLLTDLESTNGTAIEGVRLAAGVPTPLSYASTVRFGGVKLQFREVENADPESARASFREPEPAAAAGPSHFRLPLWIFILLLVLVALAAFFLFGAAEASVALP